MKNDEMMVESGPRAHDDSTFTWRISPDDFSSMLWIEPIDVT